MRSNEPNTGIAHFLDVESLEIAAWCPDTEAQQPPEQVHLILRLPGPGKHIPLLIRFKSPDTLGFIIQELVTYRRQAWPDAEPLDIHLNELR